MWGIAKGTIISIGCFFFPFRFLSLLFVFLSIPPFASLLLRESFIAILHRIAYVAFNRIKCRIKAIIIFLVERIKSKPVFVSIAYSPVGNATAGAVSVAAVIDVPAVAARCYYWYSWQWQRLSDLFRNNQIPADSIMWVHVQRHFASTIVNFYVFGFAQRERRGKWKKNEQKSQHKQQQRHQLDRRIGLAFFHAGVI